MWNAFKSGILQILFWIQSFAGDWGLAIIILTVLIRMVLWPLTAKQVRSTYEMQKMQPELKKLQEKYKDDKDKQQEELMKFYAENKVNPFASCLPMILQMPIFIALYQVLGPYTTKMLQKTTMAALAKFNLSAYLKLHGATAGFFGVITDITKTPAMIFKTGDFVALIPFIILLAVFGLSIWLPTAMMPGEKSQKMMSLYMAVFMIFIGWSAPAGVLLFWDISALIGIGQQKLTQDAVKKALGGDDAIVEEAIAEADDKENKKETTRMNGKKGAVASSPETKSTREKSGATAKKTTAKKTSSQKSK